MTDKTSLRKLIWERLHSMNAVERTIQSDRVVGKLVALERFKNATSILLYYSTPEEVFTHDLIQNSLGTKRIFLPRMNTEKNEIEIYQLERWEDLQKGPFGILEPTGKSKARIGEIDLAIIPGVAFTIDGKRLGRGKGYYDRLLALKRESPFGLGLAFSEQIVEDISMEEHDVKLDLILTG